jgi:hypothetical protein
MCFDNPKKLEEFPRSGTDHHQRNDNKNFYEVETIDRLNYSVEEKPRKFPCKFCNTLLGGGCKWKLINIDYNPIFDICSDCDNKISSSTILSQIKNDFKKFEKSGNYALCIRAEPGVIIDITDDVVNELPQTIDTVKLDNLESIVYISHDLGPIKQWRQLTPFYKIPSYNAQTAFVIECKTPYRVASAVLDDHYRMAINVIFDSYEEYIKELELWNQIKLTGKELKIQQELIQKTFNELRSCDNDVVAKGCEEFSGYIRLIKDLDMYYG